MTATDLSAAELSATAAAPQLPAEPAAAHPQPVDGTDRTDGTDGVLNGRERIDAIDAQIADLVLHRIEVSRQIQASRIADGGRRVDLRRETEIIARYSVALGRPGTTIAMALLELGRGRA